MPKQFVHALIEPEVKTRLEKVRFDLRLSSLSATISYLIDNLQPAGKRKRRLKSKADEKAML